MKLIYLLITTYTLIVYTSLVGAQYGYIGDPKAACLINSNAAIYGGYSCNTGAGSCKTNLTFRSQDPYNTLSNIARLLNVDYNDIAQANPSYNTDAVEWNKLVYVPISCSCQDSQYYYKLTSRVVGQYDSYLNMVNNTYQGLTTCQAIKAANGYPTNLVVGMIISIPLRCACPTTNQLSSGINSLYSYVVGEGDTISSISRQLKVDSKSIREANQLPDNSTVYPFTTLLIPVINNQSTSESSAPTTSDSKGPLSKGAIGGIAAGVLASLAGLTGTAIHIFRSQNTSCNCNFNCCWLQKEHEKNNEPKTKKNKKSQKGSGDDIA